MKVMLIGVHYCEGKYRSTKVVQQMLKSVGHELVTAPKEGVQVCLGRLMPFDNPKKPDVLLKAESMGLATTDLDALMGVQSEQATVVNAQSEASPADDAVVGADDLVVVPELAAGPAPEVEKPKRAKGKAKGKRGVTVDVTDMVQKKLAKLLKTA